MGERGRKSGSFRRPDQGHVTLCFISHGARHLATPALLGSFARASAHIPPHSSRIERIASWPSGAVVALPFDCPELQALSATTRDAIRRCGISPLQIPTQPPVTLAYLDRLLAAPAWLHD